VGLVEMFWEQERKSGAVLGPVVLDYIRDAVTTELHHRRRWDVLEQRVGATRVVAYSKDRRGGVGPR
jgi:hypothetical protein